jgi:hypothetical protein
MRFYQSPAVRDSDHDAGGSQQQVTVNHRRVVDGALADIVECDRDEETGSRKVESRGLINFRQQNESG